MGPSQASTDRASTAPAVARRANERVPLHAATAQSGSSSTRTEGRRPPTSPSAAAPHRSIRRSPRSAPHAYQATTDAPNASPAYVSPTEP